MVTRMVYESTNGPAWTSKPEWLSGHPCAFAGITCDAANEEITKIKLGKVGAEGELPSQLGLLSQLDTLWMPQNSLRGALPSELGLLKELKSLILSKNHFTGALPSELGLLAGLNNLLVFENSLSGSLPSELGRLSKLKRLRVHENPELCGALPAFGEKLQSFT